MKLCMRTNIFGLLVDQVLLLTSLAAILATSSLINEEDGPRGESIIHFRSDLNPAPKSKYYSNKKGTQVIEIGPDSDCHVHQGEDAQWLRQVKKDRMSELNYFQFRLMVGKCRLEALFKPFNDIDWKFHRNENDTEEMSSGRFAQKGDSNEFHQSNSSTTPSHLHQENPDETEEEENATPAEPISESPIPLIYPGTLWCGRGSAAKRTDDLGLYTETDKCCREHDQCNESMDGKSCKYGICNDSDFTRSHCDCDDRFRYCLQQDRSFSSFASFKIANLYFNILKPMCYAERHPIKYCRKHRITGECIDFEYRYEFPPLWQFFPAQPYPTVTDVVEKFINSAPSSSETHHPPPPPQQQRPPPPPPPPHHLHHHRPGQHGTRIRFPGNGEEDEDNENENLDNN